MTQSPIKTLLFDMGGVFLDVDFKKIFKAWERYSRMSAEEMQAVFKMDEAYRRHEKGEITAADYFEHMRQQLQLTASDEEIEAGWNAIFGDLSDDVLDAIDLIAARIPCYGFTNTNAAHTAYWSSHYPRIVSTFEHLFISNEIGLRKPDAKAFEHILQHAGVLPGEMLFFDDTAENIGGAKRVGIQTVLVSDASSVLDALQGL